MLFRLVGAPVESPPNVYSKVLAFPATLDAINTSARQSHCVNFMSPSDVVNLEVQSAILALE
jgi:hypothetical protein